MLYRFYLSFVVAHNDTKLSGILKSYFFISFCLFVFECFSCRGFGLGQRNLPNAQGKEVIV